MKRYECKQCKPAIPCVIEWGDAPAPARCPCCGSKKILIEKIEHGNRIFWGVGCDCGACSSGETEEEAIRKWNRRFPCERKVDKLYRRISKLESMRQKTYNVLRVRIAELEEAVKENERLSARIAELEEALLQAKVAMDYLGDILNNNDVVDAEQNDSAALNPLFAAVDNTINGIPNGRERRKEIEAATSERTKQPLDE